MIIKIGDGTNLKIYRYAKKNKIRQGLIVRECCNAVKEGLRLIIPEERMENILKRNPDLVADIQAYGGLETSNRECLMDIISFMLIDRRCPMGCDPPEYIENFYKDLYSVAKKRRIKVVNPD